MERDVIIIKDLLLRCIIGVEEHERTKKQDVLINIELHADLSKACETDNIEHTVNYKEIKNGIIGIVESSRFYLIEKMAGVLAEYCLKEILVQKAVVKIEKPGALRFARNVGVKISRSRN